MEYPWAVVGAKVAYIGPPEIQLIIYPFVSRGRSQKSPLSPDKVYTIGKVHEIMGQIGLTISEYPVGIFHAALFRPLSEKDTEMFNEMLKDIPADLLIDEAIDRLEEELEHVN